MQQGSLLVELTENHAMVCHRPYGLEWQEWRLATWSDNANAGYMVNDPDSYVKGSAGPVFYDVLRRFFHFPSREQGLSDSIMH